MNESKPILNINPEHGFEISLPIEDGRSIQKLHECFEKFIEEAIEGNRLTFGGSAQGGFIVALDGNTTAEHRLAIKKWLLSHRIYHFNVGKLVNVYD